MHNPQYFVYSNKEVEDKKIAVVSDLHVNAKTSSRKLDSVLKTLKQINPSHIVVPGDLYNPDTKTIWDEKNIFWPFIEQMKDIAPVFYIEGNSEQTRPLFPNWTFFKKLDNFHFLCEDFKNYPAQNIIHSDGITFAGLKIPLEAYNLSEQDRVNYLLQKYAFYLEELSQSVGYENFNVLLCHDPIIAKAIEDALNYDFSIYFDLIIAGHNHGGIFPKVLKPVLNKAGVDINKAYPTYTKGLVSCGENGGQMLISSGLTKYSPGFGALEKLEPFCQGTIETVFVRQRKL